MNHYSIRLVTPADAASCLEVYAPYVRTTAISFEYEVPTIPAFEKKIEKIMEQYPWLVCIYKNEVVGYTYGSMHRERTAYQWSPESTVYLKETFHQKGIARILYETLFDLLRMQGYFSIYASVLSSNNKSVAFHRKMGFEEIGLFKNIGYKLGTWHSNLWFQYFLQEHCVQPTAPLAINQIVKDEHFINILQSANEKLKDIT